MLISYEQVKFHVIIKGKVKCTFTNNVVFNLHLGVNTYGGNE